MSANAPSDAIYSPPDDFVESLLHHSGASRSQYPEPPQAEIAQPIQQAQTQPPAPTAAQTQSEPKTRLRKACDSCSARKVKCDESGPPCRSCAALDIPCTFARPSRRRGPPNKHAEAVKRQRLGQDGSWSGSGLSPTEDAAHSLASLSGTQALSAESICDIHTLSVLINDYFTYIYPLAPFPHEPTFRAAFERREDRTNRAFLALVAAMIKALVASFPRRPHQLFTSEPNKRLFPNAGALIDRCHQVFIEARGPGYFDQELSLYDAFASYLVGLSAAYLYDTHRAGLYAGESILILRRVALHKTAGGRPHPGPAYGGNAVSQPDYIKQELSRRLFWLCYVGFQSIRQIGLVDGDMVMPLSARTDLPPLPLEVDDVYIYQDRILPQPPGLVSIITGFNLNVQVFRSCSLLVALESSVGIEDVDLEKQKQLIGSCLHSCKTATDDAPKELQIRSLSPSHRYSSPVPQIGQYGRQQEVWTEHKEQASAADHLSRNNQYEIQKANVYASQLGTRSFLVEKYWDLLESHNAPTNGLEPAVPPEINVTNAVLDSRLQNTFNSPTNGEERFDVSEQAMALERENIVRDLAILLQNVDQIAMEPSSLSFCSKIRQVAQTLIHVPRSRASMPTLDPDSVSAYLTSFLDIILKLERLGSGWIRADGKNNDPAVGERQEGYEDAGGEQGQGGGTGFMTEAEMEERELVEWASLKECQVKFIRENFDLAVWRVVGDG